MSIIATTILQQLGGSRFIAMTGACNLLSRHNGLSMKVGGNARGVTHVRVTLTPRDDYEVEYLRVRGSAVSVVRKDEGVMADQLCRTFTEATGLDTHL